MHASGTRSRLVTVGALTLALAACGEKERPVGTTSSSGGGGSGGHGSTTTETGGHGGQSGATCGNGKIEGGEACEPGDLGGATCKTLGLTAGTLACRSTCDGFDTSGCRKVTAVQAGTFHACALFEDGRVKCWGANDGGQLGLGDTQHRGDAPGEMGDALPFVDLGTGRTALSLAAGVDYTCALLDDHSVKCWGANDHGESGLGNITPQPSAGDALPPVPLGTGRTAQAIAGGSHHVCALLDDSTVKCWGRNGNGQLGLGDTVQRGDQPNQMGDALPRVDLGNGVKPVTIDARGYTTCVLFESGGVKCWGQNDAGQLGLGDTVQRGDQPGQMGDALPYLSLGSGLTVSQLVVGSAVFNDGRIKCWGQNGNGDLGLGDTNNRGDAPAEMGDALPFVSLGSGQVVRSISNGYAGHCAILGSGALKCWGGNGFGELGLGDAFNRGDQPAQMGDSLLAVDLGPGRTAVSVSGEMGTTCAVLDDASVKCWGYNYDGELGLGDTKNRGDQPGQMGADLPPVEL